MKCPACAHQSGVKKTFELKAAVFRDRFCPYCGAKWTTKEVVSKGSLVTLASATLFSSLQKSDPEVSPDPLSNPDLTRSDRAPATRKTIKYSEAFDACWQAYGRHEEKIKAYDAWKLVAPSVGGESTLRSLIVASLSWQCPLFAAEGWKYAVYFERYLRRRKWEDEPPPAAVAKSADPPWLAAQRAEEARKRDDANRSLRAGRALQAEIEQAARGGSK